MTHRSLIIGLLSVLCAAQVARALHVETPAAVRISRDRPTYLSEQRTWGRYVAFTSDADLLGNGSSGRQVFLWDHFAYLCAQPNDSGLTTCPATDRPYLLQATTGNANPANPSAGKTRDDETGQLIVAFDADGSFGGLTGQAGTRRQIFTVNLTTGVKRTITNRSDGDSIRPTISKRGGFLAFESTAPLGGFVNVAGIPQVVGYDLDDNVLYPITGGAAPSTRATLNASGTKIIFESRANLLGDRTDTGVTQLFWANINQSAFNFDLFQLTNGNADSGRASVGEGDGRVVFESLATDLPGTQPGTGPQVFGAVPVATNFPAITQYTQSALHGDCLSPSLNDGGSRLAVLCNGNPLNNGSTGYHAFVLNIAGGLPVLTQIDWYGTVVPPLSASIGNYFVVLSTTERMTDQGNCDSQLHLVDFYGGRWFGATQPTQRPQAPYQPPVGEDPDSTIACGDGDPCTQDTCESGACGHESVPLCTTTTTTTQSSTTTTTSSTTTTTNGGSSSTSSSTTTTTSAGSTSTAPTTSTTLPDPCSALEDADRVLCRFQNAAPFCGGEALPRSVSNAFSKSGRLLQRTAAAGDPATQRRFARQATSALKRAAKIVQKVAHAKTSPLSIDCAGSLYQLATSSRQALQAIQF